MGRKRIEPGEVVRTVTINIKQKIIDIMEQDGDKAKHVIEELIKDKYEKK